MTLISQLEQAAREATQGEWKHETHDSDYRGTGVIWGLKLDWEPGMYSSPNNRIVCEVTHPSERKWDKGTEAEFEGNAAYIALANPANILKLLEAYRIQEKALEELEAKGEWYASCFHGPEHEVHHALMVEVPHEASEALKQSRALICGEGEENG